MAHENGCAATPAISVLVPIYNAEKYLDECLRSLQEQSFTDLEVICVNDGSTDGSRAIIAAYAEADSRFRIIDKPNSGYGASMNMGLKEARGDYIAILEADDFIEPETYAVLHKAIARYDAQVVKANFFFYWSKPYPRDNFVELYPPSMTDRPVNPQREHDIFYLKPSIWSGLYRRDFLAAGAVDFLETPGASYQDAGFNFKVWTSATRVVFLHQAFLHYRQDNEASSVNSPAKVYCVTDEYAEMERYLAERPRQKGYLEPVKAKMKYDSYMWNYERLADRFKVEFLDRFRKEFVQEFEDGHIDINLFEEWKRIDLGLILRSPLEYHASRVAREKYGYISKARHYLKAGGPLLLFKVTRNKLLR
ncbi:MAG: glycosyltransferase [Propionibacteriaceae bacterium]|jgi:glycosyltransferase involved in cell wall biosynthesis|nr:glycosyltransferase [Propionibacteriaceae bacterium]